jgi:signal transduction histidine kinase
MTKPFQSRELIARVSLQVQLGKRRRLLEEAFSTRLEEVEKRREAAELERKRQELLIDVTSHELRNPTSAIIQCSQMIGEDIAALRESVQQAVASGQAIAATEELVKQLIATEELCQNINQCGQSQSRRSPSQRRIRCSVSSNSLVSILSGIADDVLALARINLDMLQFTYQSTNIRTRAREVVTPFALEAKAKGIELVLDLNDRSLDLVPHVMTDPYRLGQTLINLVSNGLRYSGDGPIKRVLIDFAMRPEPPS